MTRTDTETSLQVLALLARGDTYQSISDQTGISVSTVSDIKKRNASALETIKDKMISHTLSNSKKILDKSQRLIENKLDRAARSEHELEALNKDLESGDIDVEDYLARKQRLERITVSELNAVSKEAFNQSQIEAGKPTSISNAPGESKQQLVDLVEALNKGDEVELFKMVLNPSAASKVEKIPDPMADPIIEGEAI